MLRWAVVDDRGAWSSIFISIERITIPRSNQGNFLSESHCSLLQDMLLPKLQGPWVV